MTNQHKVTTDALDTLGTIIDEHAGRDAIHLAVDPAVAGNPLRPGERVRLIDGKAVTASVDEAIGIVDPFLRDNIATGDRFWLVVNPRTITSLRHVWEHPAFQPVEVIAMPSSKDASEQWLRNFIASADCPDYETVIAKAVDNSDAWDSGYLHFSGFDAHGEIPPEFWTHVQVVTGKSIPEDARAEYFSCSC